MTINTKQLPSALKEAHRKIKSLQKQLSESDLKFQEIEDRLNKQTDALGEAYRKIEKMKGCQHLAKAFSNRASVLTEEVMDKDTLLINSLSEKYYKHTGKRPEMSFWNWLDALGIEPREEQLLKLYNDKEVWKMLIAKE